MLSASDGDAMEINADEGLEAQELRVDYEASLLLEIEKEKGFTKKQLQAMAEEHRTYAKVYADAARILNDDGAIYYLPFPSHHASNRHASYPLSYFELEFIASSEKC